MNVKQRTSFKTNSKRRVVSQRWNTGNKKVELRKWNRCAIVKSVFIPRRARRGCCRNGTSSGGGMVILPETRNWRQ